RFASLGHAAGAGRPGASPPSPTRRETTQGDRAMSHTRRASVAVALAVLVCLAGAPALAQSWAGRGRLQGTIKDEQGNPIEGATITLRKGTDRVDPKTDGPKPITTDKKGKWSILGLAQGTWGILIEKEGFIPSEGQAPVNEFGAAQPINITLKVVP